MALELGMKNRRDMVVETEHTVAAAGFDDVRVLSTPSMIMLMEMTCNECMQPQLDEGCASVGVHVDIYHSASTFLGQDVWAECEITEINKRRVIFSVKAFDENGEIGHGLHERAIIKIG